MSDVCLGAYQTQEDADTNKALRSEPQDELEVRQDGGEEAPWRIWWVRK